MDYDPAAVERAIDRAVGTREGRVPAFYAVGGSHLYGYSGEGADVDVRGFHVADGIRYALLDEPAEQIAVDPDGDASGFADAPDVDLVSYELRKFGRLVADGNFGVVEVVCCGDPLVNEFPTELEALRRLVEAHLPLNLPASYVGMARTNYRKRVAPALEPDRDADPPTAKTLLYVLRGLLAAEYVLAEGGVEADVTALAEHVLGESSLVDDLVAVKRTGADARVDGDLLERADERIAALFERVDARDRSSDPAFRRAVDDWMLAVRAAAGSRVEGGADGDPESGTDFTE